MNLYPSGANYEEVIKEGKKIIMFGAAWCGPCKALTPVLQNQSTELSDVEMYKIDIEEEQDITNAIGITGVPTIILYDNGEVKHRHVGATSSTNLKKIIEQHL